MISNRMQEIKAKGFAMRPASEEDDHYVPYDFSKIKVGVKNLDDAILELGSLKKVEPRLTNKETVLRAIVSNNLDGMREISNFFYRTSGIYNRLCRYLAYMYRYD